MIVDVQDALYLTAVLGALEDGRLPMSATTSTCPECGVSMTYLDNDDHIVVRESNAPDGPTRVIVVIGCEGYHVIDPNLVGIVDPHWIGPRMTL